MTEQEEKKWLNQVHLGSCFDLIKQMPDESVDCIISSPPYYALRNYGVEGQFGQEKTFDEYVEKLCELFKEARRVLKKSGSIWVNIGDSYSSSGENAGGEDQGGDSGISWVKNQRRAGKTRLPEKCQLLVPYRFAIKMVDDIGYILRNDVIWWKRNSLPSSVDSRLTKDFEYIFFFVKDGDEYYFEQQFEPMMTQHKKFMPAFGGKNGGTKDTGNPTYSGNKVEPNPLGRNKRSVWDVPTHASSVKHAAMYPEKLIETPILASCPEFICTKCGKAREKIFNSGEVASKGGSDTGKMAQNKDAYSDAGTKTKAMEHREKLFSGEYTDCGCGAEFRPGVVLDPFMGCYDDATEILTNNGWKLFEDLDKKDLVASLVNGFMEFVKPTKYYKYKYKGNMLHFDQKNFDLVVTPNHNMYVIDRYTKKRTLKPADKIVTMDKMISHCDWKGNKIEKYYIESLHNECNHINKKKCGIVNWGFHIGKQYYKCNDCKHHFVDTNELMYNGRSKIELDSVDLLKLIGVYIGEGWTCIEKSKSGSHCNIYISQTKFVKEIKKILDKLPYYYNYDSNNRFRIYNLQLGIFLKQFGNRCYNKNIPTDIKNLDKENLKSLLDGLLLGDGCRVAHNAWQYYTTSKQLADDVQEIGIKLGYNCKIGIHKKANRFGKIKGIEIKSTRACYVVTACLHRKTPRISKKPKSISYNGYVHCVEVPSHVILVRKNGKAIWCGNSGTTGLVARKLGRNFIGFELNPEFKKISQNRIEGELGLFA